MNNSEIPLWEDAHIAVWGDGTMSIHNPVMGYERCIADYNAAQTRELYEVLRKHYGDDKSLVAKCEELTHERDEARWEVCGFHHLTGFLAGDYAISRGWNYFNDERKWAKFPPSVTDFDKFLNAHSEEDRKTIERLQEENRQLRELKMRGVVSEPVKATPPHNGYLPTTRNGIRAQQGWDCFKENTGYLQDLG